ncbi:MAG: O-antigen ligase family protein [Candidatus Zixiibacteriota bacterium]
MSYQREKVLNDFLFFFYTLFIFSSTCSIAAAQISLGLALLLFLIISIIKHYNPFVSSLKWLYLFVGLYIFWMLVAAVLGKTPLESVLMIKEEWLFCAVPIGIYLLRNEAYRKKIIYAFAFGVGLFSLYGIIQHFTGFHWPKKELPPLAFDFGYIVKGTLPSTMTFGNYFGAAAIFFSAFLITGYERLTKKEKLFFGVVSSLAILVTLFSYSRGAILGLAICLIVIGLLKSKKQFLYILGAIILIVTFSIASSPALRERIKNNSLKELKLDNPASRLFIWNNSLKIINSNPVFGVGQGNFQTAYEAKLDGNIPENRKYSHAHNDFLNIAVVAGLPGMIFFAGIWFTLFYYFWVGFKKKKQLAENNHYFGAALLGSLMFFISSGTEAVFADEEVRQLLMFIWAVGFWQWFKPSQKMVGT